MSNLFIPVPSGDSPPSEQRTLLDNVSYRMTFRYNARTDSWMLDVATADGVPLVQGIRIRNNRALLKQHTSAELPAGVIAAVALAEPGLEVGRDDFGTRVVLVYAEAA